MAAKPPQEREKTVLPKATPKLGEVTAIPRTAPSATPAQISEDYRAQGEEVIGEALPRSELLALGFEKLQRHFVKDLIVDAAKNVLRGKAAFHGNKKFEKWIGLHNLIPSEYTTITVRAPSGKVWQGERGSDGSFYDASGEYITIWEGYSFEASKSSPVSSSPPKSPLEQVQENKPMSEVALNETVFVGDSLTKGMQNALRGAHFVSEGGKQTAWMLAHFRNFLREKQAGKCAGVQRVVIFGGVNDIASGKTPKAIQNNLSAIYRESRAAGLDVVACTIPQWDIDAFLTRYAKHGKKHQQSGAELQARTEAVNQWILSQKGLNDGPSKIAELDREMDSSRYPRVRDGLHFTGKASQAMAKFIAAEGKINLPRAA